MAIRVSKIFSSTFTYTVVSDYVLRQNLINSNFCHLYELQLAVMCLVGTGSNDLVKTAGLLCSVSTI